MVLLVMLVNTLLNMLVNTLLNMLANILSSVSVKEAYNGVRDLLAEGRRQRLGAPGD